MNIYTLLEHLRHRKAIYLGNHYNFDSLNSFISGFMFAASTKQLELDQYPSFGYFNTWILGYLKKNHGLSMGWHWQIRNRNPKDDNKAFDEFFAFLDIFKKSNAYSKSMLIDSKAIEYYKNTLPDRLIIKNGRSFPDKKIPKKIIWKQMQNSTTTWISYIDSNGKAGGESWFINPAEAKMNLKRDFGVLRNKWVKGDD